MFSETLLDLVKEEYRMSELALDRLRSLARQGLAIEQILLAAGLLNTKEYLALLEIASGLPVVEDARLQPLALDGFGANEMHRFEALPFKRDKRSISVAFAHPTPKRLHSVRDLLTDEQLQLIPFVMPLSVFRQSLHEPKRRYTKSLVDGLLERAEKSGLTHLRLVGDADGVHVMTDAYHPLSDVSMSRGELAACALYLKRKQKALDWSVTHEGEGLTKIIHLTRSRKGAHPLEWVTNLDETLTASAGLTVLVRHDPYLEKPVERVPDFTHISDWNKNVRKYPANTDKERELVMHSVLAGENALALSPNDEAWWSDLSAAGIPVKVIKAHVTPTGRAWEVYDQVPGAISM